MGVAVLSLKTQNVCSSRISTMLVMVYRCTDPSISIDYMYNWEPSTVPNFKFENWVQSKKKVEESR